MFPRMLLALAALPALFLGAGLACPQAKVKVTLVVILASEDGTVVDKRLKNIAQEIQKLHPSLKSFQLRKMTDHSLVPGEKNLLPLVDDQKAVVVVKHGADKDNKVGLAITPPGQEQIVYSTVCGKFLPIVTRYQTKKKERLILAVRVQPCKEE